MYLILLQMIQLCNIHFCKVMTILYFSTMGMKKCVLVKLFPTASIVTEEMRTALLSNLNLLSVEVTNQKSPLIASTELFSCFCVDWSAIEVKLLQKGSIHGSTMYILLENFQNLPCQSRKTRKFTISPHISTQSTSKSDAHSGIYMYNCTIHWFVYCPYHMVPHDMTSNTRLICTSNSQSLLQKKYCNLLIHHS